MRVLEGVRCLKQVDLRYSTISESLHELQCQRVTEGVILSYE